jgi:hypothetical protein
MIRKHFRFRRLVLGLAFAAAAVAPAAQATPEIQAGLTGSSDAYLTTEVSAYELRNTNIVPPGMTLTDSSAVRSEHSFGAPGPSAAGATGPQEVAVTVSSSSGFDWSDAGIGASAVFAAALLLLTAVGLNRRHRSRLDRTLASA